MKISKWDAADYLETPEDVAHFINAALEDGDPIVVKHAIGTAARSKGMAAIAEERDTPFLRLRRYSNYSKGLRRP